MRTDGPASGIWEYPTTQIAKTAQRQNHEDLQLLLLTNIAKAYLLRGEDFKAP